MKKAYGQSRVETCPFCASQAIAKNRQGVPVCSGHRTRQLENLRCACGSWIDLKEGKYGAFGLCINCGTLNMRKVLEMNPIKQKVKEITVTSDEVDFI